MKNIHGAHGSIGDSVSFKHGRLSETTLKTEFAIHGFDDLEEMECVAAQRGHKIFETAVTTSGEWVYSI